MKIYLYKVFNITALLIFISASFADGQITSSSSGGRNDSKTQQAEQAERIVSDLTNKSGVLFKEGLIALTDNRRSIAGEKFDKSIEIFLMSGVDVQRNQKMRECYNQLIETVYRIEFPADNQLPQVRSLSATCNWDIRNETADNIAKLVRTQPTQPTNSELATAMNKNESQAAQVQVGFNEQKFEASPLDDLAKLELTQDETNVDTPEAQQQYQYAVYAVANKSLGFSFQMSPMVQQFVNYYRGRGRATMETGLYRSGMFMRMARRIFREEGVPENVAWLAQVESAWKPSALSWAAASGLWQFIPGTGARFGLRRTAYVDERNSFEEATRASAKYLKFLANRYGGNWELAMAAYNSGEGNVDRAIRRAGVANFWIAYPYLPQETRNYVPNILATILIANSPNQYGFGHIRPAPQLTYDRIRVPASTSLNLMAQASDTTVEYLRYLNPHLRTNITPPEPYIINVPAGKANGVVALFKRLPAASRNTAVVAKTVIGESWQNIANRTGISVEDLMAANPNMPVPRGKVFVPQKGNGVNTIVYSRPTNSNVPVQASSVRVIKAKSGDSLTKIAEREGVSLIELAKFNGLLITSALPIGREIKIPSK